MLCPVAGIINTPWVHGSKKVIQLNKICFISHVSVFFSFLSFCDHGCLAAVTGRAIKKCK